MKFLITGATGYVGSRVLKALCQDNEVYILARMPLKEEYLSDYKEKIHILPYDGTYTSVMNALYNSKPNVVYHFATLYTTSHNAEIIPSMIESNITFGCYILEAMAQCKCDKIIYATTSTCYDEHGNVHPLTFYSATKQSFSNIINFYTSAGLLRAITIVLSDTYGPGDNRPKVLNLIKKAVKKKETIALSNGLQEMNFVYIDDVVRSFVQAASLFSCDTIQNQIFQIASDTTLSLRETVETMLKLNHATARIAWGKYVSNVKIPQKIIPTFEPPPNWSHQVSLAKGLKLFWKE